MWADKDLDAYARHGMDVTTTKTRSKTLVRHRQYWQVSTREPLRILIQLKLILFNETFYESCYSLIDFIINVPLYRITNIMYHQ